MKFIYYKLLILVVLITVLTGCNVEEEGIFFNETTELKEAYSVIELDIMELVNNYRIEKGLNKLEPLNFISSVALSHTNYMVDKDETSHDNFSSRQEVLYENAGAISVGENVAYGFNSGQGVVSAWLKSVDHKSIIENENYTHFGISIEKNKNGRNYFTQIFIKR